MEPSEEEPEVRGVDTDDDDYQGEEEEGIDFRFAEIDDEEVLTTFRKGSSERAGPNPADRERLERALQDLVACRELLDEAIKAG